MLAMAGENDHANGGVLACYHPVSDRLLPNISIDVVQQLSRIHVKFSGFSRFLAKLTRPD